MKGQMWSSLKIPLAGGGKGAPGHAINGNKLSKDAAINKRWKDWKLAQCLEIQKELKKIVGPSYNANYVLRK